MLKRIPVTVAVVILLLSAVALTLCSFSALHLNKEEGTEPLQTQAPTPNPTIIATITPSTTLLRTTSTPTQTPQLSPSVAPTKSLTQTQTPQISANPTSQPTNTPSPQSLMTYNNLAYGTDPAQKFDIYVPKNIATKMPTIIFIHGGAWIAGDKNDVSPIAVFIAQQGFVVINMNYRLLPTFSYPAPMEDIQMVLRWANLNSGQYKIDISCIGMSGHSAGGHLASLYALTQDKNYIAGGSALPRVYAIAPMAGGYTLAGINVTSERRNDTILEWLSTANPQSLGLPIDQIDQTDNVTFLLLHGSQDANSPPSQSILFNPALTAKDVQTELKIYLERTHLTLISGIPNNDEVAKDLITFFEENLK
jgi:acetyl esterase/lipase